MAALVFSVDPDTSGCTDFCNMSPTFPSSPRTTFRCVPLAVGKGVLESQVGAETTYGTLSTEEPERYTAEHFGALSRMFQVSLAIFSTLSP